MNLSEQDVPGASRDIDLIARDEAEEELAQIDAQQAGLSSCDISAAAPLSGLAEVSPQIGKRTVDRDWQAAEAWLLPSTPGR